MTTILIIKDNAVEPDSFAAVFAGYGHVRLEAGADHCRQSPS
jgi:hypothetical protein